MSKPRLLVIEDEDAMIDCLRKALEPEGYRMEVARNGVDGLHRAMEGDPDLILLDQVLPGIDGIELLVALRQTRRTPVLMLSPLASVEDRVRGLDAGADDYLVKPAAMAELRARIDALLRRSHAMPAPTPGILHLADLTLDVVRAKATRAGRRLILSSKELRLLALMLQRPGEVLTRRELAEAVWEVRFDHGTNLIDVAIRRLRTKLDEPFERPLLHTVRGMGYVLEERED